MGIGGLSAALVETPMPTKITTKTIYWHETGAMLTFKYIEDDWPAFNKTLFVFEDLNPEVNITWAMSRWELFKIGWKMMIIAIEGK